MAMDQSTPGVQDDAQNPDDSGHGQHAALDRIVTRAHELKDKQRSNLRDSLRTAVRLCMRSYGPGLVSLMLVYPHHRYDSMSMRREMSSLVFTGCGSGASLQV